MSALESTIAELRALGLGPKPATEHVANQWADEESER